eukprot:TRINITY_DN11801_c1_g1_i1.p1 TRINITY_DN11801_c1_g1~~TRINITY_DN11801_c1_g1_i1.p1  ORF type:complete len:104 (-),score=0.79 TRINITY_DN11801_c1_g1_i1:110-421(-)
MGYLSQAACLNSTGSCSGVGRCLAGVSGNFSCFCLAPWYGPTCAKNYYFYYEGKDSFFWLIGIVFTFILLVLGLIEVILHIKKKTPKDTPAFLAKVMIPTFCI